VARQPAAGDRGGSLDGGSLPQAVGPDPPDAFGLADPRGADVIPRPAERRRQGPSPVPGARGPRGAEVPGPAGRLLALGAAERGYRRRGLVPCCSPRPRRAGVGTRLPAFLARLIPRPSLSATIGRRIPGARSLVRPLGGRTRAAPSRHLRVPAGRPA